MSFLECGEPFLKCGVSGSQRLWRGIGRRGQRNGLDLMDRDRAATSLMDFGFQYVRCASNELGLGWLRRRWRAVRDIANDPCGCWQDGRAAAGMAGDTMAGAAVDSRVGATGTSCERTRSEPTRATKSAKGSGFITANKQIESDRALGQQKRTKLLRQ